MNLRAIVLATLGALLAACSSAGVSSPSSSLSFPGDNVNAANGLRLRQPFQVLGAHGWLSPTAKTGKHLIYWGDYSKNTIAIYSSKGKNGKAMGEITTGLSEPERLFVDSKYNVYATNAGNDTITAYKPGASSPFLTISDGVSTPTGLTVDAAGTVYCANVGNDTITEYKSGQTSAALTIDLSNSPEYLATDSKDNLYAAVGGSEVLEFAPGSTTGTDLDLDVTSPSALEVDRNGNLIVIDSGSTIDYIPAGKKEPSKQIAASGAFTLSLSENEKVLYAAVEQSADFVIEAVAYPNGSALSHKLTTDAGQWPLAVSPDNALGT